MSRTIFFVSLVLQFVYLGAVAAADVSQDDNANRQQMSELSLDPQLVCNALADEDLEARGGYKKVLADGYRCASPKKNLNAGGGKVHEITFYASGNVEAVSRMGLELSVYSKQDMQRAHRLMKETAERLMQRTLGMALPTEVADAIMGAVSGHWIVAGRQFSLRRKSLPFWGHELTLSVH